MSRRLTILVVENDESINRLVCLMLERILGADGCRLLKAATGEEALRLTADERPELITLDLNLPGIHGEEVLRRLQDDQALACVPVIVISAWPYEPEGTERPAVVLEKPFRLEELRQAVQRALGEG